MMSLVITKQVSHTIIPFSFQRHLQSSKACSLPSATCPCVSNLSLIGQVFKVQLKQNVLSLSLLLFLSLNPVGEGALFSLSPAQYPTLIFILSLIRIFVNPYCHTCPLLRIMCSLLFPQCQCHKQYTLFSQ